MARDWKEWAEHIFSEIKRAAENIDTLDGRLDDMEGDMKVLKLQVRVMWGLLIIAAGAIVKTAIGG